MYNKEEEISDENLTGGKKMPCLVSGGEIATAIYDGYAETEAEFYVAPPFDGEIVLPFIPEGSMYDMTVLQSGNVFFETKAINIREFNASPVMNSVTVSKRADGRVILRLRGISDSDTVEIKIKSVSRTDMDNGNVSLIFPCGWGEEVTMNVSVMTSKNARCITSPSHEISTSESDGCLLTKLKTNVNGKSLILNIAYDKTEKGSIVVSRRLLGDNVALCSFIPGIEAKGIYKIEAIGGMGISVINDEIYLSPGKKANCFILHRVIPPKGVRIKSCDGKCIEEIYLDNVLSKLLFLPVEIMCAECITDSLKIKMKEAKPEDRCLIREEINDLCIKTKTVKEDVALVSVLNGTILGKLCDEPKKDSGRYLNESITIDTSDIIERILSSQTVDGVIADMSESDENVLVFSTAVCLIALYLYTGDKYKAFAKRSVKFLEDKKGYWQKTALKLWNGESVDKTELAKKSEMKIMYQRLDELAVLIIKNHGRTNK